MENNIVRILLIEDDDSDALIFERVMHKNFTEPFRILRAKSLKEAHQFLLNCDVIVTDLGLPDSVGPSTVLNIYTQVPHVPLIVLSGNQDYKAFNEVIGAGAHDYLVKGVVSAGSICRCILASIIRKKVELQLIQASENKTNYVAQMSHEIRTPLNVLLGFLDILKSENTNKDFDEYLSLMDKTGFTIKELLDDILDLSKIEAGKLELDESPFDLHLLLSTSLEIFKTKAQNKGLELVLDLTKDLPKYFMGDSHKIRQVIFNLIGNSIKFTNHGKIILFAKYQRLEEKAYFSIEDTGVGIPPNVLNKLFTPFEQGGMATTKQYSGTGLGLAISKNLVELMKGQINAKNNVKVGSTFSFFLPLQITKSPYANGTEGVSHDIQPILENKYHADISGLKILIADDSVDSLRLYKAFLKKENCLLDAVEDGLIAIEHYKQIKYDVVILDYQMPKMSGLEVAQAIRKLEKEQNLKPAKLIMLTGDASKELRDKAEDSNIASYLIKPIGRNAFICAIIGAKSEDKT